MYGRGDTGAAAKGVVGDVTADQVQWASRWTVRYRRVVEPAAVDCPGLTGGHAGVTYDVPCSGA